MIVSVFDSEDRRGGTMRRYPLHLLFATVVVCLAVAAGEARGEQGSEGGDPPAIHVRGESMMTVEPDWAEVQLGVESEGPTAEAVARDNALRLDAVLKALRDQMGPNAEIKTTAYSLLPVYSYGRDRTQSISHYKASNIVSVQTGDLDRVGEIITLANREGANTVKGISFSLKDDSEVRRRVLADAAREARAKAEALATALGVRIKRILRVDDTGPSRFTYRGQMNMKVQAAPSTPVEPGNLEIRGSVTLTVEIGP